MPAHRAPPGAWLKTDTVVFGVEPHVDDLREVDVDVGVLGLQLEPAVRAGIRERLAEGVVDVLAHSHGQNLSALEADVDASGGVSHQWPSGASTSSVSTPPVDFGCRKATRLPRMPTRGSESINSTPTSFRLTSAVSMSSTR